MRNTPAQSLLTRARPKAGSTQTRLLDASIQPSSYNSETRSVTAILATETPVERWGVREILKIDAAAIDMTRAEKGMIPLLDSHEQESINSIRGRVTNIRIENKQLLGDLFFAETVDGRAAESAVAQGLISAVSVGYPWPQYDVSHEGDTETWTATRWELTEVSLVSVPADPAAVIRAQNAAPNTPPKSKQKRNVTMDPEELEKELEAARARIAELEGENRVLRNNDEDDKTGNGSNEEENTREYDKETGEAGDKDEETRAANIVTRAIRAERKRGAEIRRQAGLLGLSSEKVEKLIERGISVESAQRELIEMKSHHAPSVTQPSAMSTARTGVEECETRQLGASTALVMAATRSNPTRAADMIKAAQGGYGVDVQRAAGAARDYVRRGFGEIAAMCMGVPYDHRDRQNIIKRAVSTGAHHTTGDFANVMNLTAHVTLRNAYNLKPPSYRAISRQETFLNFQPHNFATVSDYPDLMELPAGAEIKHGTMNTSVEVTQAKVYARRLTVDMQAMINDDFGIFDRVFGSYGRRASRSENKLFYGLLKSNSGAGPKMQDGNSLFQVSHKNTIASGTALNLTNLAVADQLLMQQTDKDDEPLNIESRRLLVGPALKLIAKQLVTDITATKNDDVNPYSSDLDVVIDAEIDDNSWYLFGDENVETPFIWGYVQGYDGPMAELEDSHTSWGVDMRCILPFGLGSVDRVGAFRNPGT